jgi:hypothetical protein
VRSALLRRVENHQKALYGMAELFFGRTFRYRGSA